MEKMINKTGAQIATIFEYQKHILLSRLLIKEFEEKGMDTKVLEEEIAELEAKIAELKLNTGYQL